MLQRASRQGIICASKTEIQFSPARRTTDDILSGMAAIPQSGIVFQERDLALLRGLFESRVMTSKHVAALYFDGRAEAAKKRLQKLKAEGLVTERPRRAYEPSLLFLGIKAFRVLLERGCLSDYPKLGLDALQKRAQVSELTLRHELEVMDVKATLMGAVAETPAFSTAEFSTWPLLYQFSAHRPSAGTEVVVKPDGFLRIMEQKNGETYEHTFFLEVDRSTETQDTLGERTASYLHYYQSGGLAVRHRKPRSVYKDFPFRVLMVFKNAERRNNTAERLLHNNPPILTIAWLTTRAEVLADPLGSIWIRPVDYRDATANTPFAASAPKSAPYLRQPERENFVEAHIKKSSLLGGT